MMVGAREAIDVGDGFVKLAATTFGPLEKYAPANDNGGYVGLRRVETGSHSPPVFVPERAGDFMQTATGRKFWPMAPSPDEVFIEDIAHSLSMQCRYAGHCLRFYSVAEHSVLIARHLAASHAPEVALWGLLHDASEAYLIDVPRPVKPYLTGYKMAEAAVMEVVCRRFGLAPFDMPPEVHEADERIIADELVNLVPMDWHDRYAGKELGVRLRYWTPEKAREEFMATFEALTGRAA